MAAKLLAPLESEVGQILSGIDYAPIVGIHLGIDSSQARHPIDGFGFLIPRDAGLTLLGCLFMSQLFPGRAPQGRELLTCMLGGTRWRECVDAPDDELAKRLFADLERTLGLRGDPETLAVVRWRRAVSQPGREHPRQVARVRELLARHPGLELAAGYLDGVSVPDTLASGSAAATRLLAASA